MSVPGRTGGMSGRACRGELVVDAGLGRWCEHGLASWAMILAALARGDANFLTRGLEERLDN